MARLRKIGMLFFARLQGLVFAVFGLAAGVLYSFGGALYDLLTTGSLNGGSALAFLALIGMPMLFGLVGFGLGLVEALVYNLLAHRSGGIEADFETRQDR